MLNPSFKSLFFRIDSGFVIKVADFGLSESIDSNKDYFRQGQDDTVKLPIKWLTLESINDGIFSEKTDVVGESYELMIIMRVFHLSD